MKPQIFYYSRRHGGLNPLYINLEKYTKITYGIVLVVWMTKSGYCLVIHQVAWLFNGKKSLARVITNVTHYNKHKWNCDGKYDMLILCGYMPNDNYNMSNVDEGFATVCNEMECIIKHINPHFCLIGGDMNTDFWRDNAHAKWVQDFNDRNNRLNIWNLSQIIPQDTFVRHDFCKIKDRSYIL